MKLAKKIKKSQPKEGMRMKNKRMLSHTCTLAPILLVCFYFHSFGLFRAFVVMHFTEYSQYHEIIVVFSWLCVKWKQKKKVQVINSVKRLENSCTVVKYIRAKPFSVKRETQKDWKKKLEEKPKYRNSHWVYRLVTVFGLYLSLLKNKKNKESAILSTQNRGRINGNELKRVGRPYRSHGSLKGVYRCLVCVCAYRTRV